jgi:hypothetical protein
MLGRGCRNATEPSPTLYFELWAMTDKPEVNFGERIPSCLPTIPQFRDGKRHVPELTSLSEHASCQARMGCRNISVK